ERTVSCFVPLVQALWGWRGARGIFSRAVARGVGCPLRTGLDAGDDQLQSPAKGEQSDHGTKPVSRNAAREQATQEHAGQPAKKLRKKHRRADRAYGPVENTADHCQYQAEKQVRADDLRRRHFRVIEKQHRAERAGSGGREPGFDADRKSKPGQPLGIPVNEFGLACARRKMKSCSESQHDSEKDDVGRVAAAGGHKAKHQGSRQKARNRAAQQQPEIPRVNLAAEEIERGGNQTHKPREHKGSADSFPGRKTRKKQESGHGETSAADSGKSDGERNNESDQKLRHSARSEKV